MIDAYWKINSWCHENGSFISIYLSQSTQVDIDEGTVFRKRTAYNLDISYITYIFYLYIFVETNYIWFHMRKLKDFYIKSCQFIKRGKDIILQPKK